MSEWLFDLGNSRLKFCARHRVAIGFMYELRCPDCGELHFKDDLQLRCPH